MNNTTNTENKGILTTFYSTLNHRPDENEVDDIVIPIVQRDYAQGRPSAKKVRERFLDALFNAIDTKDSNPIELDFIYGDLKLENRRNIFYPLDGQQRLTTLFLLHWYVAKRISSKNVRFLESFSYQTRESSKQFCEKLVALAPDFGIAIDEYIKDLKWYNQTWASDPTIASMLTILRDIDDHYRCFDESAMNVVWKNLIGNDDVLGKIRFYRLDINIKDIGITDDLYIKMNSRGKPLTDFEHFKAELGKYTKDHKDFMFKVDTSWTNLLWCYRDSSNDDHKDKYEDNGLDKRFLNLIRSYLTIVGIKRGYFSFNDVESIDDFKLLADVFGKSDSASCIDDFSTILDFFCVQLNLFGNIKKFFLTFLSEEPCSKEKVYLHTDWRTNIDLLYTACSLKSTLNNVILLNTFFQCALKYRDLDVNGWRMEFTDRLRVIRNLMINSIDQIRNDSLYDILLRVDKIVESGLIESDILDFTKLQKAQEEKKLEWIGGDQYRRELIYSTENHQLLYGNLNIFEENNGFNAEHLDKFKRLFSRADKMDLIQQALLCIDDYGYYINGRISYGGSDFDCNGEWRNSIFINNNKTTPKILNELFDKLDKCDDNELEEIIKNFISECKSKSSFPWRYYLAEHIGMRHGKLAKYSIGEGQSRYECVMMNKTNFRGKHWNPFLFTLSRKIDGCTITDYGAPLILPGALSELSCYRDCYVLIVAGEGKYTIPIRQDENGIDTEDRIAMLIPPIGENVTEWLKKKATKNE